jgi:ABC-type uncharacterized transport system involved in gliding motility auxiliary subunit
LILIHVLKYLHLQKPLEAQGCSNTNLFGHNYPMRTIEELEKYYESASNTRIKEIASDKESLSPEALQILELEIEKRGFIQEDIQTKIIENQRNMMFFSYESVQG